MNEWPNQTEDLQAATDIINHYIDLNEGEPLGLIEVIIDKAKKKPMQVRFPDWILGLVDYFSQQYGKQEGRLVASKVVTRILLKDETLH